MLGKVLQPARRGLTPVSRGDNRGARLIYSMSVSFSSGVVYESYRHVRGDST
jgi:hypothetical protein